MMKNVALVASVAVNAVLCIGVVVAMYSSSQLGAPVTSRATTTSFSRAVTPAQTFRSAVAQAYCEEVVDPTNNARYETMSYLPDFNERDMENQVNYMINNGLVPCIEFDKMGTTFRENSRMPNYYDGRYWTLWKLPMFGATNARSVMQEVNECKRNNPDSYIRILGFDNIKQVQCVAFLASKPGRY
uniref:Ribulose bisphosphate carboxylase small subunit, chloroplastic n=1 Tax=Gymnochlora stellata TaxID=67809 RepID=B5A4J7_GYMST|nr:ribulose bisphosphate carboxylase/oxygenase small subunit 1 [Gymnochlora stellata]